ncbi:hypothetical protein CABS01_02372 [Colletotrichum abscissum]|uniref:Enoyl reductase (ER) domain-containing protein n=1 Tax=Colletotrichum abscissum TaxID=1671311 RepID=A0A9P9XSK5_9PEZI|nr:uncharacterized protein CABS01_02372 [Colletotrichum abscissum]KAI3559239.1 hypothetical protein CABS02_00214 [Colletotrichum abscissum]KAK1488742.1 hypothetical protein CABS01_02372 [Colletotrichum abscissum]
MSATTIRKAVITEFGDVSKVQIIQDTIEPPPANHVQVSTIYSGFSGADINMRKGVYPMQKKAPLTPGYCLVGTVKTTGPGCTSKLSPGDLVACLTIYDAEAELVNLPEKYLIRVPPGTDLQQATALILDWNTAYAMVFDVAKVSKGQRVFIHGVSGAVGYALMKLCQLQGAEVYGTASERNHAAAREQGAHPFVYTDKKWMQAVKELGGADAVFDPLGFESWDESFSVLSPTGILVGYGGNLRSLNDESEHGSVILPTMKLMARGMVPFCGKRTKFYYITRDDATFEPNLKALLELVAEGKITVPIKKVIGSSDEHGGSRDVSSPKASFRHSLTSLHRDKYSSTSSRHNRFITVFHSPNAMKVSIGLAAVTGLAGFTAAKKPDPPKITDFDWDTITPARKLEYHPCYKEYQCARLSVPLDWLDEANEHTVALAIIKLPATVPDDDPSFGGTVFTNPGGPGGSGVSMLLRNGHDMRRTLSGGSKKYEMLSWDPRGVQFTTPVADCYEDELARDTDNIQRLAIGPLDASPDALRRQWARIQGYGRLCTEKPGNGSIIPFATTASVCRDMVEMVDKIDEFRKGEAAASQPEQSLELRKVKDVPRIQYWGFSYGSILGNTFASMYPGRVGRLIVDGIADSNDYVAGGWKTNLQDTEKLVDYFYETCFEAKEKCALSRPSDKQWQDIRDRVDQLVKRLDEAPVAVLNGKVTNILTGYDVILSFKNPLYAPYTRFIKLANEINAAIEGNYTAILESASAEIPKIDQACTHPNATDLRLSWGDGGQAVLCGDGEDNTNMTLADYRAYVAVLESQSPTFAGYWGQIRSACTSWLVRPKWRFTGPFTTPPHDAAVVEGRPAAPLLFMSSRLDPVTPLRNAFKASEGHPGSVVVIQESVGHAAFATGSKCTTKILREYLEHGTVPESGTVCQPDCGPWDGDACKSDSLSVNVAPLAPPHDRSHRVY